MSTAILDDGSVPMTGELTFGAVATESGPYKIKVTGSGGATPATKGTGYGRNLIVAAGQSDNSAGVAGGDLYLRGGAPLSPATVYGDVIMVDQGGKVRIINQLIVGGVATFNGKVEMPGTAAIGEATEIAEANADVVRIGDVVNDWGDYAKFIGAEGPGRWHWGAWENMSSSPKSIVFAASPFKVIKGVTAWGLVHNVTANTMGRFDVGPLLINTTNTLYDAGGGKTAVLQVANNGSIILYKTGSDELDIVYQLMWI